MVKHGALSKFRVYELLRSKDARVRRAAFILLEASNPALRRNSEVFLEIIRFIWEANPSYNVYREFSQRHMLVPYKVHELISARLKIERRERQGLPANGCAEDRRRYAEDRRRYEGGFFKRFFGALQFRKAQRDLLEGYAKPTTSPAENKGAGASTTRNRHI
jgi:hypothetical protein